jgi:hypothetical protein
MRPKRYLTEDERLALGQRMKVDYDDHGMSIRDLAEKYSRSYAFVHDLLVASGTTLRGRGGPNRNGKTTSTPSATKEIP